MEEKQNNDADNTTKQTATETKGGTTTADDGFNRAGVILKKKWTNPATGKKHNKGETVQVDRATWKNLKQSRTI